MFMENIYVAGNILFTETKTFQLGLLKKKIV